MSLEITFFGAKNIFLQKIGQKFLFCHLFVIFVI